MKPIFSAVIVAALIIISIISCNWFDSAKKVAAFDIHGTWVIDSLEDRSKDTSAGHALGMLALTMVKDSVPLRMEFREDGGFTVVHAADTLSGTFELNSTADSLRIYQQDEENPHEFLLISSSDSAFVARTKDSLHYFFRRR